MADAPLTEFQKWKISQVFNILYDSNKDGVIEEKDFEATVEKVRKILEWSVDCTKYIETKETLALIWEGLKLYADSNKDGEVSIDEWVKMWEDCIRSNEFPAWQKKFMDFMFNVSDKSGDGVIDKGEYINYYRNYISQQECEEAFDKISEGQTITKDNFEKLWKDYFFSDNLKARGNYLFGVPKFSPGKQ